MNTKDIGVKGEKAVARYLRLRLYRILERNYNSRYGELDIIATNWKYLCFVEVKTRSEKSLGSPAEYVDKYKQNRLIKTAFSYLKRNPTKLMPRFDIAEVYHKDGKFRTSAGHGGHFRAGSRHLARDRKYRRQCLFALRLW